MKALTQRSSRRLILTFLAGTLLAFSFPNINLPALAWLAPGMILWFARNHSGRGVFLAGSLAGLGNYLISLYWLLLIPFPWHGLAAYLGLSAVMAMFLGGWCWSCWRLWPAPSRARRPDQGKTGLVLDWRAATLWQRLAWPFLCAVAWVVMEMTAARLLTGFPWNFLGVSQFRWLALIQVASLAGVYAVSFLVAWVSVSLLSAVLSWSATRHLSSILLQALPPIVALAGSLVFGWLQLSIPEKAERGLRIALIQPAIPQRVIWNPDESANRMAKLVELSRTALAARPDLLVWPETAMPEVVSRNRFTQETIAKLLQPHRVWMVLGASDFGSGSGLTNSAEVERYNGAFLVNPAGEMAGVYHKHHLVPFGEFMPGARTLPWLGKLRAAGAGLARGERDVRFQMVEPRARFPVLICYEDMFPHEVRHRVDEETDFLLNLTNNGWFGESAAQWQHGIAALFRAVELGLPLVRCSNNGLTCWMDARGRLHNAYFDGSRNIYQAGYKIVEVPFAGGDHGLHPTVYRHFGDWFGWGCFAILMGALAAAFLRPRRHRVAKSS